MKSIAEELDARVDQHPVLPYKERVPLWVWRARAPEERGRIRGVSRFWSLNQSEYAALAVEHCAELFP